MEEAELDSSYVFSYVFKVTFPLIEQSQNYAWPTKDATVQFKTRLPFRGLVPMLELSQTNEYVAEVAEILVQLEGVGREGNKVVD